ncbi:MAG: hypothetical protein U1E95_06075 [Rubrivivax sp.]
MQYEKRKDAVEAVIWKVDRASISDLENDPRIIVVALGMLDVGGRKIHAMHLLCLASVHRAKARQPVPQRHQEQFASRSADKLKNGSAVAGSSAPSVSS